MFESNEYNDWHREHHKTLEPIGIHSATKKTLFGCVHSTITASRFYYTHAHTLFQCLMWVNDCKCYQYGAIDSWNLKLNHRGFYVYPPHTTPPPSSPIILYTFHTNREHSWCGKAALRPFPIWHCCQIPMNTPTRCVLCVCVCDFVTVTTTTTTYFYYEYYQIDRNIKLLYRPVLLNCDTLLGLEHCNDFA